MDANRKPRDVRKLTVCALCAALLSAASFLVVPLPFSPVPVTLQSMVICLIGLLLPPGPAALTVLTWLIMGLVGLPVFAGGTAGPGKLFGPMGGFYAGFLLSAPAVSLLKGKGQSLLRRILASAAAIPLQHFCGAVVWSLYQQLSLWETLPAVSLPFLPGDGCKAVLAAFLAGALNRAKLQK